MAEKPTPSTEVVHGSTGELLPTPPDYLRGLRIITDFEDVAETTIKRIMSAETPEDALADPSGEGLRDLSGKTITITQVIGISPSTIKDHTDEYYLRFEARTEKGLVSLSTGSPYAAAGIVKLANEGWLPRRVRILELVSKTDTSRSSLWVVDAGSVVAGTDGDPDF